MPKPIRAAAAKPPMTPPAMAPAFDDGEVLDELGEEGPEPEFPGFVTAMVEDAFKVSARGAKIAPCAGLGCSSVHCSRAYDCVD